MRLGIASNLSTVPADNPSPLSANFATGMPAAARRGIKVIVTLSPTPPVECLSTILPFNSPKIIILPDVPSASVR